MRISSIVNASFYADSAPGYILFYGTLMRGFELRRRTGIEALLRFVGTGAARGALFDLGPYPAAVRA